MVLVRMARLSDWRGMCFVQCLLFEEGCGAVGESPTWVGLPTGTTARLDCLPVLLVCY